MTHTNFHTHTTFSDGKNTPEEMVQKAVELGLSAIGISDHSETLFDRDYCMAKGRYLAYQKELCRLKGLYRDQIDVFCGIEQDSASPRDRLENFDYVIGSVHYIPVDGEHYPVDHYEKLQWQAIESWGKGDKMEYARRYFDQVAENAVRGGFSILGHFDLVNKFSLFDPEDDAYRTLALSALDTVLGEDLVIEVNTGGLARGYKKLYPAPFLLSRIREKGGKIMLNGDSHSAETLTSFFDDTVKQLLAIGFSSLYQWSRDGWKEVNITKEEES